MVGAGLVVSLVVWRINIVKPARTVVSCLTRRVANQYCETRPYKGFSCLTRRVETTNTVKPARTVVSCFATNHYPLPFS